MRTRLCSIAQILRADEDGVTTIEYALIVAVIAVVALAGAKTIGTAVSSLFSKSAGKM